MLRISNDRALINKSAHAFFTRKKVNNTDSCNIWLQQRHLNIWSIVRTLSLYIYIIYIIHMNTFLLARVNEAVHR